MNLFAVNLAPFDACYRTPEARPFQDAPTPPPSRVPTTSQWYPFPLPQGLEGGLECFYYTEIMVPLLWERSPENQQSGVRYEGTTAYTETLVRGVPIGYYYDGFVSQLNYSIPENPRYRVLILVTQTTPAYSANPGNVIYTRHSNWAFLFGPISTDTDPVPTGRVRLASCPANPTRYTPPRTNNFLPQPNGDDPMPCCNTEAIEEMLRLLMKRLGTTSYPVSVPKSLVDDSIATEKQESLTELLFWTIKQMDGLAGQFPIEMEIKDADPSQQGDQARKVKISNIAEGIAELMGLNIKPQSTVIFTHHS